MTKVSKNDPWRGVNSSFPENDGPKDDSSLFSPVDVRGLGLRTFCEQALQARAATSTDTNMTLVPGKLYLRQQNGLWELIHNRDGRGTLDYYGIESQEQLIELAQSLLKGNRK